MSFRNHAEEIAAARAGLVAEPVGTTGIVIRSAEAPRDPLDEASYALTQAVADFYVLIRKAETSDTIMRVWRRVNEMENLIAACASAAGRKADAL